MRSTMLTSASRYNGCAKMYGIGCIVAACANPLSVWVRTRPKCSAGGVMVLALQFSE